MKIAVVGAGAIGSYYGAKLAHAGTDVHFLMRSDLEAVRGSGIEVRGRNENFRIAANCYGSTNEIGACDLVLIALKTIANETLIDLLPPLLHTKTMLLTLQNGLGNEEFLAQHFGTERVLGGLCYIAVDRVAPGIVEHYARGEINLGEFSDPPRERTYAIARIFERAEVPCRVVENLALERWRKLVWNVAFNGLSIVAGGIDTQALLRDPHLREETRALMDEISSIANACGVALEKSEAERQIAGTDKLPGVKPSTLVDFERSRPLEIEAIWGEPLRRAQAKNVHAPRLHMLYALLLSIEQKRSTHS